MYSKEMFLDNWKNKWSTANDSKDVYKWAARDEAIKHAYISNNRATSKNIWVMDVDANDDFIHGDAATRINTAVYDDGTLPEYNWLTVNPTTGNAHVAWVMNGEVRSQKGLDYFKDSFKATKNHELADPGYTNTMMYNPLAANRTTIWGTERKLTIAEFSSWFPKPDNLSTLLGFKSMVEYTGGRNTDSFNTLRQWAYRNGPTKFNNYSDFLSQLLIEGDSLNREFKTPLSQHEIIDICDSIGEWVWQHFSRETFSKIQSSRAKKRWAHSAEDRAVREAQVMAYKGAGVNLRDIASSLGLSYDQTKKIAQRATQKGIYNI
jgi:hypothetical protein